MSISPDLPITETQSGQLVHFDYNSYHIRTLVIDGEPWFVAKDICSVLDLENVADTLKRLDEDEKDIDSIYTPGGKQKMLIVNEPGLYNLIFLSRKPEARTFKRWVTHKVLPQLRKTGRFTMDHTSPAELILAQAQQLVEQEKVIQETKQLAQKALDVATASADFNSGDTNYFTIRAFCNLHHIDEPLPILQKKGRQATTLSRKYGIKVYTKKDEMYGRVNQYALSVLEAVFKKELDHN